MKVGDTKDMAVYKAMVRAAEAGRPCPTNDEICGIIGLTSTGSAARAVHRLEAAGVISVQRFSMGRIVTITATGQKTAEPACLRPHWRAA